MTLTEIKRALLFDYETELKSKINLIQHQHKSDWIRCKKKETLTTIHFETKTKNKWRLLVQTSQYSNQVLSYLCFYDEVGINVYYLTTNLAPLAFLYYNTHFFKRYRERMKLNIEKPEDLIKHFIKNNIFMVPHAQENEREKGRVFTRMDSGAGLGLGIYHEEGDIFEFKTFVDLSLLTENQKKKMNEIFLEYFNKLMIAYEKRLPNIMHKLGLR